jgi:H+/Cl- antiporter ClcA
VTEPQPSEDTSSAPSIGIFAVGGAVGGLAGAAAAVIVTLIIKESLGALATQNSWVLMVMPLVGLVLSVVILQSYRGGQALQTLALNVEPAVPQGRRGLLHWRPSSRDVIRADLTADVVATAGAEERFPWHLAPPRIAAIIATVALGAPMGTESPAAHIGTAAGAWLGTCGSLMRRLARPAALGGGAASVAALIGNPLVGAAFMLELGRRRRVPLSAPRLAAGLVGALVGWGLNRAFDLKLIVLNVPDVAPSGFADAMGAALLVGVATGTITSLTGSAVYRARGWQSPPLLKLVAGGLVVAGTALLIAAIAGPRAAFGPGAGAAAWAETPGIGAFTLLAVALLRAIATTAAVAAGGCGGIFVPFLAIGDIAGRAFAPVLGVPSDLAGAAGAAGGIAGGYRLPVTALALVVGLGGPGTATLTCLATVLVATAAGVGAGLAIDRIEALLAAPTGRGLDGQ